MTRAKWITTGLIVLVVGMQGSTFLTGGKVWPFMAYCMYSRSQTCGELSTADHHLVCIASDGSEHAVTAALAGLRYHALKKWYIERVVDNKSDADARLVELAGRIERCSGLHVAALRLDTNTCVIADSGIECNPHSRTFPIQ
jgi:hypothetical protein